MPPLRQRRAGAGAEVVRAANDHANRDPLRRRRLARPGPLRAARRTRATPPRRWTSAARGRRGTGPTRWPDSTRRSSARCRPGRSNRSSSAWTCCTPRTRAACACSTRRGRSRRAWTSTWRTCGSPRPGCRRRHGRAASRRRARGVRPLGGDVVVKPLFGAEGRGMVRVTDPELAWRTFRALEQTGELIYRTVHPPPRLGPAGVRARREGVGRRCGALRDDWRTNVAQGGRGARRVVDVARRNWPSARRRRWAARSRASICCPGQRGEWYVIEVNAVPGWGHWRPACGIDIAAEIVRFVSGEAK